MAAKEKVDVHQMVTDRIIQALEAGIVPWHKPWKSIQGTGPTSLSTGREYQGINTLLLSLTAFANGYTSAYWGTFKQIQERGGSVRKGEKGTAIVFWRWVEKKAEAGKEPEKYAFLRYFTVFNLDQTEGVTAPPEPEGPASLPPIEEAERIQAGMPKRPEVRNGGDRAFYSPTLDYIQMPLMGAFESSESWYATLFHEMVHSTAHESRLGRKTEGEWEAFGSESYSREELVAEMGAAFLCAEAGIEPNIPQHASYIGSWLSVLRNDKRFVVQAASQAGKAAEFILGREKEGGE